MKNYKVTYTIWVKVFRKGERSFHHVMLGKGKEQYTDERIVESVFQEKYDSCESYDDVLRSAYRRLQEFIKTIAGYYTSRGYTILMQYGEISEIHDMNNN